MAVRGGACGGDGGGGDAGAEREGRRDDAAAEGAGGVHLLVLPRHQQDKENGAAPHTTPPHASMSTILPSDSAIHSNPSHTISLSYCLDQFNRGEALVCYFVCAILFYFIF